MIKIENIQVVGFEPAIRGMRNPMNSWEKSDSSIGCDSNQCSKCGFKPAWCGNTPKQIIGPNDHDLMIRLAKQGPVHGKFRRMIVAYMDITAPLYWWKEFDTYKVGTVANSCSTMHKIHAKEFTREDFSHEQLFDYEKCACDEITAPALQYAPHIYCGGLQMLDLSIYVLNFYRKKFLEISSEIKKCHFNELEKREELVERKKKYWWQMIQLLPSSYNQRRTVMLSYEVLANIRQYRGNHKLDEWREFCRVIKELPYSEIITCGLGDEDDA